jgi:queuine tRNA-ribosyltransferase
MFNFTLQNTDGLARAGEIETSHGNIQTPIFMPVGTKASVKGISKEDLHEMGAEIILNNTYHLYLRPGDEVVKHFWGAHSFQNYQKPILTDSGGFQVFSLGQTREGQSLVKITEDGVHFRSYIDGSKHYFTPERVMDIQSNIGADIIMAFDECAPGNSSHTYARAAMERTHRWAERSKAQWLKNNIARKNEGIHEQALFGIVQWVIYDDLRKESAKFISDLDTPGISIWWLSVGESKEDMYRILDIMGEILPQNKPRYLMGVGTPEDLIEWIYRWVDMFDCVLPTRIGRHGRVFTHEWNLNIKNEKHRLSDEAIDTTCSCKVCKNYSRWYLRHLIWENEMYGMSLLSYHNLYFLLEISRKARTAIQKWEYWKFREKFWERYKI